MDRRVQLLLTFGLGAAAMYMGDPVWGRRRQALVQDQVTHLGREAADFSEVASRDLVNRIRGVTAQVRNLVSTKPVADSVLAERVRAKLGRIVSHPHAVHVDVQDGRVRLTGPVLKKEAKRLMQGLWSVRGIKAVDNHLEVHRQPDISALQGGRPRESRMALAQRNWAPGWRLLMGAAGTALAFDGWTRLTLGGVLEGITGAGLMARAIANRPIRQLLGLQGRRSIELQKEILVQAPVDRVFDYWQNFENFPQFMHNVREVRQVGNHLSHWVVAGPMGSPVQWDAMMTQCIPNQALAWKTTPESLVQSSGRVKFEPMDGGTRIDLRMTYAPLGGVAGDLLAMLLGADPKAEIDSDLNRMKVFLETGIQPHDAAARSGTTASMP